MGISIPENNKKRQKVLIFGTGRVYQALKEDFFAEERIEIIGLLDNDVEKQHTQMDGVTIYSPKELCAIDYDYILVAIKAFSEVRKQLIDMEVSPEKVVIWQELKSKIQSDQLEWIISHEMKADSRKCLIFTTDLGYDGGSWAIIYAAEALAGNGYDVSLVSSSCDEKLQKEIAGRGFSLGLIRSLPFSENIDFITDFDVIIVNVYQMLPIINRLNGKKPVLWWIHEPSELFDYYGNLYSHYVDQLCMDQINVIAVSDIPKDNFNKIFPGKITDKMQYCLPCQQESLERVDKNKIIVALIGAITPRKDQECFIKAVELLPHVIKQNTEFWIIGDGIYNAYGQMISGLISDDAPIVIKGKMTRAEIDAIYPEIDIVVCSSVEDPLPMVMTEAMAAGKICITSTATGTAGLINNKVSGYIFEAGLAAELSQTIETAISKYPDDEMRLKSRAIYDDIFAMDSGAHRIDIKLQETIDKFEKRV